MLYSYSLISSIHLLFLYQWYNFRSPLPVKALLMGFYSHKPLSRDLHAKARPLLYHWYTYMSTEWKFRSIKTQIFSASCSIFQAPFEFKLKLILALRRR
jgi:hypothetical protein